MRIKSTKHFKKQIELLEKNLKIQKVETEDAAKELEIDRAELKYLRDKIRIKRQDIFSQTNTTEDIPYKVTDPLPPIFNMELSYKSMKFLSRSLPNINSFL